MDYPKVMNTKTAAPRRSLMDLSSVTISTLDFGLLRPIFSKRMYRGDKFSINMSSFVRLLPVGLPTLGECYLETHAVFVPYRLLSPYWMPFIDGRSTFVYNGQTVSVPSNVPTFSNNDVVRAFLESESGSRIALCERKGEWQEGDTHVYDFVVYDNHQASVSGFSGYDFTPRGRAFYALLRGLGYSINWVLTDSDGEFPDETIFNAFPLLSYLKYYYDYVINPCRDDLTQIEKYFSPSVANISTLSWSDLIDIASYFLHGNYDSDYFNSAWTSQNGNDVNQNNEFILTPSAETDTRVFPFDTHFSSVKGDNKTVFVDTSMTSPNYGFSYEQHQLMMSLYNYMRRNQLVGTRYGQQLLARFGFQPSDVKSMVSDLLNRSTAPIQISDVTATATGSMSEGGSTYRSALGSYAGKGIGYDQNSHFEFTAEDYGQLLIIATIKPKVHYWQGRDRQVLDIKRLDFFTPEFEKVGTQALRFDELYSDYHNESYYQSCLKDLDLFPSSVFGFTPRYCHEKIGHDLLIGDFNCPTLKNSLNAFHLFRNLKEPGMPEEEGGSGETPLANNSRFVSFDEGDRFQYDRMFTFQGAEADHFICRFDFAVKALRPMNTIVDTMLTDEDLTGEYVKVAVNGVK